MVAPLSNRFAALFYKCGEFARRLLGGRCVLCAAPAEAGNLCRACENSLPYLPQNRCPVCALPTPTGETCGGCLADPPEFDSTSAIVVYHFPADGLIHAFKYRGRLALAGALAELMLHSPPAPLPDFLIPMPLAPARLRERGFNQALEIARRLAVRTGTPLMAQACKRVRDTAPQVELPWKERAKNIRGAFTCDADLTGMRVAIVDDVMTTGATLNELAKVLRRRGAKEVTAWVVARTLHRC